MEDNDEDDDNEQPASLVLPVPPLLRLDLHSRVEPTKKR